ncbi:MAG: hypothetical protein ABJL67_12685 [Sulfitobacter sp.]
MPVRNPHSRSTRLTRKEKRLAAEKRSRIFKLTALGIASSVMLLGFIFLAVKDAQYATVDAMGCYASDEAQPQNVVLIDSSDPRWTAAQQRDLLNVLEDEYHNGLPFNAKLSVISTDPANIGSVPDPAVELCGPAKTSAELEAVGAKTVTQVYLDQQAGRIFEERLLPALDEILALDPPADQRQSYESPILEQIQAISRMRGFGDARGARKLTIISDMLQSTGDAQFCYTKGHLPSFGSFKDKPFFARVKPDELSGTEVTVYALERGSLGPFCRDMDELMDWWQAYFEDAGAQSVRIIRLRQGAYVAADQ